MPSPLTRTVIKQEHPSHRYRRWATALGSILLSAAAGFWLGFQQHSATVAPVNESDGQMRARVLELQTELALESNTVAQLRRDLAEGRSNLAELEQQLDFYQRVMAPEEVQDGVILHQPNLQHDELAGVWHYEFVVQQGGKLGRYGRERFKGHLQVTLMGLEAGFPATYTLADLLPAVPSRGLPLDFRFFQRPTGSFTMPVGFKPQRLALQASITSPSLQTIEAEFDWQAGNQVTLGQTAKTTVQSEE